MASETVNRGKDMSRLGIVNHMSISMPSRSMWIYHLSMYGCSIVVCVKKGKTNDVEKPLLGNQSTGIVINLYIISITQFLVVC